MTIEVNHNGHDINDFMSLIKLLWDKKRIIIAITSFFAIISIISSLLIPNEYRSSAVLVPAGQGSTLNIGSQLQGLLPAGIDLGSGSAETDTALEIMKSWKFIETFIQKNNLQLELGAIEAWDPGTNKLIIDSSKYDEDRNEWKIDFFSKKSKSPSSYDLYIEFSKRIVISESRRTGLVSISFDYYSPYLARSVLDSFIYEINDHMRNRKVKELTNNIESLQNQIQQTDIAEMREVLFRIMGEQTKSKLLAEVNSEFAFKIASPPMVPEMKIGPQRTLIVVISTIVGGLLSIAYTIFSPIVFPYFRKTR